MPCTSCQEDADAKRQAAQLDAALPMHANDLQVVEHNKIRPFNVDDWPADKHKLLVFYPQTFTPVCRTELGAINQWVKPFAALDCMLIAACTDQASAIADWYRHEALLHDLDCLTFSSYLLPVRLGLVDGNRAKRSSVFVMADGEIIKQEHFARVGRSFAELHRMLYGYTTGSYCAEGWQSLADGFLE
jgi:alkyl hydroperoxide reductase subunit AhpC